MSKSPPLSNSLTGGTAGPPLRQVILQAVGNDRPRPGRPLEVTAAGLRWRLTVGPLPRDTMHPLSSGEIDGLLEWPIIGAAGLPDLDGLPQHPTLLLSVSTSTAQSLPLAHMVATAVLNRLPGRGLDGDAVVTALGEAIANGIVHGNLGIASLRDSSIDALAAHVLLIGKRLADPALAEKRITLAICLSGSDLTMIVRDSGQGFSEAELPSSRGKRGTPAAPVAPAGRGLALMRSFAEAVTFSRGGSEVTLRFSHSDRLGEPGNANQ